MADNMSSYILSLEDVSLYNIIDNFSYFSSLYRLAETESLKMNMLFLQRKYTKELLHHLHVKNTIEEEHLDFLLNEYLEELNISSLLSFVKKETILEKIISLGHNLHTIYCYRPCNVYDSQFLLKRLIPHLSNVSTVSILSLCNDELLKLIAFSCPGLTVLDIQGSTVTGKGIRALYKCPIKFLNLLEISLEVDDVVFLIKNLPRLEKVFHDKLPFAMEFLYSLGVENNLLQDIAKYNLQSLDLLSSISPSNSPELTRILSISTKMFPKLKALSAQIFNTEDLNLISCFSDLDDLNMESPVSSNVVINNFLVCKGRKLKILSLHSFTLNVSTLIEYCPNLENLDLNNIVYQELDKNSGKSLNRLRTLRLNSHFHCSLHCLESAMKLLNSSPKLKILFFVKYSLKHDYIAKELLKFSLNCNLKFLVFRECKFDFDFFQQFILNCKKLRELIICYCEDISLQEISILNQTIEACNRKIVIDFDDYEGFGN